MKMVMKLFVRVLSYMYTCLTFFRYRKLIENVTTLLHMLDVAFDVISLKRCMNHSLFFITAATSRRG